MRIQFTLLAVLAAAADAVSFGSFHTATSTRVVALARASSPIMRWDPMTGPVDDDTLTTPPSDARRMAVPAYVTPPPEYALPEDGCEIVSVPRLSHFLPWHTLSSCTLLTRLALHL